jgi:hypothetical protein
MCEKKKKSSSSSTKKRKKKTFAIFFQFEFSKLNNNNNKQTNTIRNQKKAYRTIISSTKLFTPQPPIIKRIENHIDVDVDENEDDDDEDIIFAILSNRSAVQCDKNLQHIQHTHTGSISWPFVEALAVKLFVQWVVADRRDIE